MRHLIILGWIFGCSLPVLWAQETQKVYLSGTGNDHTVDWEFYCTDGRQSGEWTTIPVPSCWELQGFGTYNYGHDNRNKAIEVGKEQGRYRHRFEVPREWKGEHVDLVFQGVMTDAEVRVNGKSAGPVHQGAFYQFSYDISDLLSYGKENTLEVTVSKFSSNMSVNYAERYADYWIFGGIFRPVFLAIRPEESIERVAMNARADGAFYADVFIDQPSKADRLVAKLLNADGQDTGQQTELALDKQQKISIQHRFSGVDSWSPEYPHLYHMEFDLYDDDELLHRYTQRFGFRTVEVRPKDGIYVNGVKVRLKGVNRHSFYPSSGRTTSKALSIQDVQLMKDMNMNAVRMSHYPPDDHFLEACDSLGLLVLDELAGWQAPPYDTEVGEKLVREMVIRDVNHPSIILWDNGNEGGWNTELDDDFGKYDPQKRHVIHPWAVFDGTDTQHYKPYGYGTGSFFHGDDIFFPTEFLHGLYDGGHGAGLEDYWDLMRTKPQAAGGFLWCLIDEGVVRTDQEGRIDTDGNHAPDGILGPYREKEGSFYAIKQIWSPVQPLQESLGPRFNGSLPLENRFYYTDLADCTFEMQLATFRRTSDSLWLDRTPPVHVPAPRVAPGNQGELDLPLPGNWKQYDILYISAYDPHGREIYTWSYGIQPPSVVNLTGMDTLSTEKPLVNELPDVWKIDANGMSFHIHKRNGQLVKVLRGGVEIPFGKGPVMAHDTAVVTRVVLEEARRQVQVEVTCKEGFESLVWTVYPTGILKLAYSYRPERSGPYWGVSFSFPEEQVEGVQLLARGPYRAWKNRTRGNELAVWNKPYNNTITGESWNYPEFKGYYDDFYAVRINAGVRSFTVASASEQLYLRLFTPGTPAKPANTRLEFPAGDIGFMHGIHPIGTKFMPPAQFGPQSQHNSYSGWASTTPPYAAHLYFDFR